jgi:hypothetical protein
MTWEEINAFCCATSSFLSAPATRRTRSRVDMLFDERPHDSKELLTRSFCIEGNVRPGTPNLTP